MLPVDFAYQLIKFYISDSLFFSVLDPLMMKALIEHKVYYRFAYVLIYSLMRQGLSEQKACEYLRFTPIAKTDDTYRIPIQHVLRACHTISHDKSKSLACIQLGLNIKLEDFGVLARTLSFCPTPRSAFSLYNKMSWLLNEPAAPKLVIESNTITVRLNNTPEGHDFVPFIEFNTGSIIALYQQISGGFGNQYLKNIYFSHSIPAGLSVKQYEHLLGCKVSFDCEYNAIVIDASVADFPMHTADQAFFNHTQPGYEELTEKLSGNDLLKNKIANYIHNQKNYQLNIDQLANELGVSISTIKRRLKSEHTHFQQVLDQARLEQATKLIDHSSMGITDIANELGYQSPASFSRAFKRWLGISARQYRQQKKQ